MAEIDVGSLALNRTDIIGVVTWIDLTNPANLTGKITQIKIWANTNLVGCEIATFFLVSGTNYSTRSSQAIGNVTAGSEKTFAVNLDVMVGDFIGMYYSAGDMEAGSAGGSGLRYEHADLIPCTNADFPHLLAGWLGSLYGTGKTLGGPKSNPTLILIGHGGI